MFRIGIDVGGTNTDAVIMKDRVVMKSCKTPTTEDVMRGVLNALNNIMEKSGVNRESINSVMIGTTHFTNAVIQRRELSKTGCVRLGLPATASLVPMVDWPEDLREVLENNYALAHGGYEFDGRKISEMDSDELKKIAEDFAQKDISSVAISAVFSPVNTEMEHKAKEVLEKELTDAHFTLSSDIGRIGLLERENAAIMNACIRDLSEKTINAFKEALIQAGLNSKFYLTQNDGTLMSEEHARKYPVLTFASGPTNSMRGAAFLSGLKDAIVIDIGGTTTDVGALHKGFPRQASIAVEIGGVRTNFRMPDVFSIGLGGGSKVISEDGNIKIGPQSVGYRLTEDALIFGGDILTASDIAVAAGMADFGDTTKITRDSLRFVNQAVNRIQEMLSIAAERMRLSPEPIPVIVVGGGSILALDQIGELPVERPENHAVANAVGAAIAQISGEIDRVYSLAELSRDKVLEKSKEEAEAKAVEAGAKKETIKIVDVEDVPLAYLPGNATRVRVKAVGDLDDTS